MTKLIPTEGEKMIANQAFLTSPETRLDQETIRKLLIAAYLKTRKHKRGTCNTHVFETHLLERIDALAYKINNRVHELGSSTGFINHRPVDREIFAAPFEDRILHTLVVMVIEPWWEPRLDKHSFSCRKNKGTLYAINELYKDAVRCSENFTKPITVIKMDFKGYFMSIDRKKLYERMKWGLDRQFKVKNDVYRLIDYLAKTIYLDDPIKKASLKKYPRDWKSLPSDKSLLFQPKGKGLPIGNFTSQQGSNIFLDEFDRFMRFEMQCKYYGRYVDDSYVILRNTEKEDFLKNKIPKIRQKASDMGITLHPKKFYIQDFNKGVEFLGAKILPYRILPGKRIKHNFQKTAEEVMMGKKDVNSLQSYLGLMQHYNSDKFIRKVFDRMGWDYPF